MNRIDRDKLKQVALLTGSRAFGVASEDSDYDWLISEENFKKLGLDKICKQVTLKNPKRYSVDCTGNKHYKFGFDDFIVYSEEWFKNSWMAFHNHCLLWPTKDKKERIFYCEYYIRNRITKLNSSLNEEYIKNQKLSSDLKNKLTGTIYSTPISTDTMSDIYLKGWTYAWNS